MNHPRIYRRFAVTAIAVLLLGLVPSSVAMAAGDHFVITGPTVVTGGVAHSYTVTAVDASDVVLTGYTGTVVLADGRTTIGSHTFDIGDAGVRTFTGIRLATGDLAL